MAEHPVCSSVAAALAAAVAVALVASPAVAQDSKSDSKDDPEIATGDRKDRRVVLDYQGKLQDGSGKPISGVFNLRFNVYDDPNAKKPIWSETQYIGIVDGTYKIPLGRTAKLTRSTLDGNRWIGIELVGGSEILRDKLQIRESRIAAKSPSGSKVGVDTSKTRELIEKARKSDNMAFADVAERAVLADKAKVADTAKKIGSMSAEKVKELSNLALERLGEHVADPNAHQASGGGLGDGRRVMESVGGPGGKSYEKECPPGWVVTGITGGQGRVVDSLAIICKPLK